LKRFIQVFAIVAVLAGVIAGSAAALAFDDADYIWPNGEVGTPYYKQLLGRTDVGVPGSDGHCHDKCKFVLINGSLPPGLTLHSDGLVDGTPTKLGVYSFWIQLQGRYGGTPAEREFSINVNSIRLTVTTPKLPAAIKGASYSQKLEAAGGGGSYSWSVTTGKLPDGVNLASDGTLSGTPTTDSDNVFTVKAADPQGRSDTKQFEVKVVEPLGIKAKHVAEVGLPFSATLTGTGGSQPYTFAVSGAPAWLTFDGKSALSGTPTAAGAAALTITMTDANGLTKTLQEKLLVTGKVTVATRRLKSATTGSFYRLKLRARGGARPFRWSIASGRLPRGIKLNRRTGWLMGTAQTAGSYRFEVALKDGLGGETTHAYTLVVG
jgi:putative Ig domain-containing protein